MLFTISKRHLMNALATVSRAISPNSPVPALSCIKIEATENQLIFTAADSTLSIKTIIDKSEPNSNLYITETGGAVLDKVIVELVKKIDSEVVTIETLESDYAKVSGVNVEYKIHSVRFSDYPAIEFDEGFIQLSFDASTLISMINQTTFAVSKTELRPVLTGVNFHLSNHQLILTASDSYRLARKVVEVDSDEIFTITIPARSLNEMVKNISDNGTVTMGISDKRVQFKMSNTLVQTRLLEGAFPETERLIPSSFTQELTIDKYEMIKALDVCSPLRSNGMSLVKLCANTSNVNLSTVSKDIGSGGTTVNSKDFTGDPIEISFSGEYAKDAINSLDGNEIVIKFCGETRPFIICDPKDDSLIQLVLPIRTYN